MVAKRLILFVFALFVLPYAWGPSKTWANCSRLVGQLVRNSGNMSAPDLRLAGHRMWDNWGHYDSSTGLYHRFALASDEKLPLEQIDWDSHIRHFTSRDATNWVDQGPVVSPRFHPEAHTIWSGSTYRNTQKNEWELFFTSRRMDDQATQSLWVTRSKDSMNWREPRLLADPLDPAFRSEAERLGYHFGDADGIISALRDPFREGDYLYFATKAYRNGQLLPAIGKARIDGNRLALQQPEFLPLPSGWTQIELPALIELQGRKHLMVSVTNGGHLQPRDQIKQTRVFLFEWSVRGQHRALPPNHPFAEGLLDNSSQLYTANPLRYAPTDEPIFLSFHTLDAGDRAFSLPPPLRLQDMMSQ